MVAWNTDPTPSSGIAQVWTRGGVGRSNYLRYDNPAFDALVERATGAATRDQARRAWRAAIETITADAPGIFLFATDNVAAFHNRIADVRIRPDSWAALLRTWRIPPDRLIDRDRVER
jgi:ABC-type transport system substrate-binding protein